MKAIERITKYGLKKYLKSCRKLDMTPELIEQYKFDYGSDIPLDLVVRYNQTVWKIEMEREGETWEGTSVSALHAKPDYERDMDEAFRNAQHQAGETGWTLTYAEKIGKKRSVYHAERREYESPKAVIKQETLVESLQQKRDSIAISLKKAGYSAIEVVKALVEVK